MEKGECRRSPAIRMMRLGVSIVGLAACLTALGAFGAAPAGAWVSQTHFGKGVTGSAEVLTVQPDGKIVAAGYTAARRWRNPMIGVARFLPDGSADESFGARGRTLIPSRGLNNFWNLTLQPDGKILILSSNFTSRGGWELVLSRVDADGRLDEDFGDGGAARISFQLESSMSISHIDFDDEGRILIAGTDYVKRPKPVYARQATMIWRLLPDGSPDRSFDDDGVMRRAGRWSRRITGVQAEPDGTITLIGASDGPRLITNLGTHMRPTLMKFTESGEPDLTFNGTGIKQMPRLKPRTPGSRFTACQVNDGTFDHAGRAVSLAMCFEMHGRRFLGVAGVVGRYLADGSLDPSFNRGRTKIVRAPKIPFWGSLAIAPDNSMFLGGSAMATLKNLQVISQLDAEGRTNPAYGPSGVRLIHKPSKQFWWWSMAAGSGGSLYAGTGRPLKPRKDDFQIFSVMSVRGAESGASASGVTGTYSERELKRIVGRFNREGGAAHREGPAGRSVPPLP